MKRVYTTDSVAMAWHIRNVLEQYGIDALVKNDKLYAIAGEVPLTECMPEVWVKPLEYIRAEQIIRELESDAPPDGPDWLCENCGESNAASFDICWNCQHDVDPDAGDGVPV
jgi:hypothetical protein